MSATAADITCSPPPRPTIWQRLGYRACAAPLIEPTDGLTWSPTWFTVEVRGQLSWRDRLRALLSGNILVVCAIKTETEVQRAYTTSAMSVLPPGKPPTKPKSKP